MSERELLAQDLHRKYFTQAIPLDIVKVVFDLAWEAGHASGAHEVEQVYDEISSVARAAFHAGREAALQ